MTISRKYGTIIVLELKGLDIDYVRHLIDTQDDCDEVDKHIEFILWGVTVYYKGVRSGVCYISKIDRFYFIDAYKDETVKTPLKISYIVGKLVIDVTKSIYKPKEIHSVFKDNKRIEQMLCKLQFYVDEHNRGYTLMRRSL